MLTYMAYQMKEEMETLRGKIMSNTQWDIWYWIKGLGL